MNDAARAVLIVDDNADLLENLAQILTEEGVRVLTASNGRRALELIHREEIALVVSDMRMPEIGGLELLRQIRAQRPELVTVMMTAYSQEAAIREARRTQALDVLSKPIPFERLFALIELALSPKARVLVLEDDVDLAANLAELVESVAGCLPMQATTVAEARRIAEVVHLDGAVLDVRLPDGDGASFAQEDGRSFPTALVSGFPATNVGLEDERFQFFEKPFDSSALTSFLSRAIGRA
ncbi:MAG: response regulator [Deltaproteobacteria bacterium]|nr:response regulator [Deltaproteobacteria bacterium]